MIKVTDKELLVEIEKSKELGEVTSRLGELFLAIAERGNARKGFGILAYKDDIIAQGVLMMCKSYTSFKPEKSDHPYSFFSQIASCAAHWVVGKQHRESEIIKDYDTWISDGNKTSNSDS